MGYPADNNIEHARPDSRNIYPHPTTG
ncbi:hypothetical protein IWX75_003297 [Arthrobacter sp. CAN_A6]